MQPYYNNRYKFKAIIDLINRCQFKNCQIVIGDTNYQHTLKINLPNPSESYNFADKIGKQWIAKNYDIITELKIPYKLSRWKEWVLHPRYQYHRDKLDALFAADLIFQESFLQTAADFIERNHLAFQISTDNYHHATQCCLEYLKEECAIIMPLWAELKYSFIIYPTKMLNAMEETYTRLVLPNYSLKPHWLSLRFSTKIVQLDLTN